MTLSRLRNDHHGCSTSSLLAKDEEVSKLNDNDIQHAPSSSSRYGSTGTLSTLRSLSSSSSGHSTSLKTVVGSLHQEGDDSINPDMRTSLSIDLVGIIDSEQCDLISGDSIISSSNSSSSSDDDNSNSTQRYHRISRLDMLKRYARTTANSFLTLSNFKVLLSYVLWWMCYMFMGIFGGSVAYMHFPRTDKEEPDVLPDFGYDHIPYYCPVIPHVPSDNVQSLCLVILYTIICAGVILRWKPRYHPITGQRIWGGDGRLILQQLYHLNCLIFVTRTSTVAMTGLPQPNPKCIPRQHDLVTFEAALQFVMGRGFPPRACGDLIYSGHVSCTLICMTVLHRHGFLRNPISAIFVWSIALIGIYFTISCRSHYTVDVILACYFGYFLPEWYLNRSNGIIDGRISRLIRYLEVRPNDLEIDDAYSNNNWNTVLEKDFNKKASAIDEDPPLPTIGV